MYGRKVSMKVLIFAKSIDGGTGTFFLSMLKIGEYLGSQSAIKACVLEKPHYRKTVVHADFCHRNHSYPERYSVTPGNLGAAVREVWWFRKQVRSFRPDIVLSIDIHCAAVAEFVRMLGGSRFRHVATIHNNLGETLMNKSTPRLFRLAKVVVRRVLARCDRLVATSRSLANSLEKGWGLSRVYSIHNGIPLRPRPGKTKNSNSVIIWTGRMVEQKDPLTLLGAFAILAKIIPRAQLWLAGDGPLEKTLRQLAGEYGLVSRIRFFGWVQDAGSLMDKADLFVLTSRREGFGYVLVEAMSRGLPVVSTDCHYGPSEILEKGRSGILVPVGAVQALAGAMAKALTDKGLYARLARASYRRSNDFDERRMLGEYADLIRQAADQ